MHAALRKLPVSVISTLLCAQTAPGFRNRADEFIDWLTHHLLPLFKRRKFADCAAIGLETDGFSPSQAARFLGAACSLGIPTRVHAGRDSGAAAIALAIESGAASDDIVDPGSRPVGLSQSAIIATLLPGEPFYLGTARYPPRGI